MLLRNQPGRAVERQLEHIAIRFAVAWRVHVVVAERRPKVDSGNQFRVRLEEPFLVAVSFAVLVYNVTGVQDQVRLHLREFVSELVLSTPTGAAVTEHQNAECFSVRLVGKEASPEQLRFGSADAVFVVSPRRQSIQSQPIAKTCRCYRFEALIALDRDTHVVGNFFTA